MDADLKAAFNRLAAMILETQAKLHAANLFIGYLLKKQGLSAEAFEKLQTERENSFLEGALLNFSDRGEDFARALDLRGLLCQYEQRPPGK
jgi:hypothetical protein